MAAAEVNGRRFHFAFGIAVMKVGIRFVSPTRSPLAAESAVRAVCKSKLLKTFEAGFSAGVATTSREPLFPGFYSPLVTDFQKVSHRRLPF